MGARSGSRLLLMRELYPHDLDASRELSLDWHLLEDHGHGGIQALVRDLNRVYRDHPALWERDDDHEAFGWLEPNDADANVLAFVRWGDGDSKPVVAIANNSPVPREGYRVGLPRSGEWTEVINTDAEVYGGSNTGNMGAVQSEAQPWHDQPFSAGVTLPPLGVVWLVPSA